MSEIYVLLFLYENFNVPLIFKLIIMLRIKQHENFKPSLECDLVCKPHINLCHILNAPRAAPSTFVCFNWLIKKGRSFGY